MIFPVFGFRVPGFLRLVAAPIQDGHRPDVRSNHNPVVAEEAKNMAMHSPRPCCHDRIVVAPNQIPTKRKSSTA
jgi:hypothetical protein